jgi:hypothetical protein
MDLDESEDAAMVYQTYFVNLVHVFVPTTLAALWILVMVLVVWMALRPQKPLADEDELLLEPDSDETLGLAE